MVEFRVAADIFILFLPVVDLVDAAARILIQRDEVFVDEFGISRLDPVGGVFGVVFAGFGDVIAEAVHHFEADQIAVLFLAAAIFTDDLRAELAHLRIDVLAVFREFEKPCHMVDAGDLRAVAEVFKGTIFLFIVEIERHQK